MCYGICKYRNKGQTMNCKILMIGALALSACTTAQVTSVIADGQLFCAVKGQVVAVSAVNVLGVSPVIAKGAGSVYVAEVCAIMQGIAVAPPLTPESAPTVIVPAMQLPLL